MNTKTDREEAIEWWEELSYPELLDMLTKYKIESPVSDEAIYQAWQREFTEATTPTPIGKEEELFTKGEWYVDELKPCIVRMGGFAKLVQTVELDQTPDLAAYENFTEKGEAEANARLIAASKEMYFALKGIVEEWTKNNGGDIEEFKTHNSGKIPDFQYWSPSACMVSSEFISKARAALSKAITTTT